MHTIIDNEMLKHIESMKICASWNSAIKWYLANLFHMVTSETNPHCMFSSSVFY